jgi:hypothetical protein
MRKFSLILIMFFCTQTLSAQENYEIQVYASPTMTGGATIFELHSNFTFDGGTDVIKGVRPTNHALHETLEITHGITDNFELGFYLFTNYTSGYGYRIIGSHIRPRIAAPEKWKLPVGLSLSAEFGYQSKEYSDETWSVELRPIIDKTWNKFYLCFNPTLGFQVKGIEKKSAPAFAPNIKTSYAISSKVSLGAEYYGDLGAINHFENGPLQSHTLFAAADLFLDPKWEINFGPGWGLTPATDHFIFKLLVGRRIMPHKHSSASTQ